MCLTCTFFYQEVTQKPTLKPFIGRQQGRHGKSQIMLEFGNTKFINLKFINLSFKLIENENHFDRMQNRGRKKYQITPVLVKITRGYMVG